MVSKVIERKICLEHEFLCKDMIRHLFQKTKRVCENDCTKEDGYILLVKKIKKIKENYISSVDGSIIFIVDIEVDTLKPEIDDIYNKGKLDKYDQGQLDAYEEILDYMEKKAEELGFNLLDLSPKAVKEVRKKRMLK